MDNSKDENFAEHPQTVGELRAQRSDCGSDWTPRDVLIHLLRDIDSGATPMPTAIFIAFGRKNPDDGNHVTGGYLHSAANYWEALGIVEAAKQQMSKAMTEGR